MMFGEAGSSGEGALWMEMSPEGSLAATQATMRGGAGEGREEDWKKMNIKL